MSEASDLVGKIIKTDIGNLQIKKCKYSGLMTGENGEVIKCVEVKTKCGTGFNSTIEDIKSVVIN